MKELYDAGLSRKEIAARLGLTKSTVAFHIRLAELLVIGRKTSRGHLKARLINERYKEPRCERCGISEWQGKPLTMALHHINGDGTDNRLENLQLLCPNCHAQTPNYGGRNGHRRPPGARPREPRVDSSSPEDEPGSPDLREAA